MVKFAIACIKIRVFSIIATDNIYYNQLFSFYYLADIWDFIPSSRAFHPSINNELYTFMKDTNFTLVEALAYLKYSIIYLCNFRAWLDISMWCLERWMYYIWIIYWTHNVSGKLVVSKKLAMWNSVIRRVIYFDTILYRILKWSSA
jgi:hypothetical protein